jgi:Zn-dependent peptidase ImmA (M78 family)/transcriptional regulator with XRE-family HTH domain
MAVVRAKVKPELLKWGRTSAGFTVEEAAAKAGVKPDQVVAWETPDSDRPTMNQLRTLAKAYKRPISVFYLSKAPRDPGVMHDFRRLPGEVALVYSPALRLEIRAAYQRREVALSLLEEIDQKPQPFTVRAALGDDPEAAAMRAREALGITYDNQVKWHEERRAYNTWRRAMEDAGVLVFQIVGIPTTEMRGFSIAEDVLPVIAVNVKDKPNGRTFSLLHEFTHLMLHESGLCDFDEDALRPAPEQRVEIFCNHVAGAALVPREHLLREPIVANSGEGRHEWSNEELEVLARRYAVSREVVLRRLLILGRTTAAFYGAKRQEFLAQYKRAEAEQPPPADFKRNLPQEAVSNYGRAFAELVVATYHQDRIALSDAAQYLGVRAKQLPTVEPDPPIDQGACINAILHGAAGKPPPLIIAIIPLRVSRHWWNTSRH